MGESRIGRVVVASLHQALADHLPTRLEFYESYLRPLRMRAGAVGVASFSAALSFLKHEDAAWDRSEGEVLQSLIWSRRYLENLMGEPVIVPPVEAAAPVRSAGVVAM